MQSQDIEHKFCAQLQIDGANVGGYSMKAHNSSMVSRVRHSEGGQTLVMVPLLLALLLAAAAVAIDMGNLYYCYNELKSATRAAALAGGGAIASKTDDAVTTAKLYTGYATVGGIYNIHPNLDVTSAVAQMGCISTTAYPNYGLSACATYGVNTGNSIRVTETANVHTFFARVFGVSTIPISATAIAAATGGATNLWNLAIILDTTPSMNTVDTNCGLSGRNPTRLDCALDGVQTLLKTIAPCSVGSTCTASNASDRVSLFTFPNVSTAQAANDYNCGGATPTAVATSFPTAGVNSYSPTNPTPTYQVTGYLSDYQGTTPTSPPSLSGGSNLVKAVGSAVGGCTGLKAPTSGWPGGVGNITYYAGVIYAAQASLLAQQAANPQSQNAMILLSDGDAANAQTFMASTATSSGLYPSWVDQCGQAVGAAQAAMAAGTRVYSVAYGSASAGCSTDTTGTQNSRGITPCQTMEALAGGATSTYFYSDYNQSGSPSACQSAAQPLTNLHDIFQSIGNGLLRARLVPGNLAFTAN
jgi:Flp pilus assembly protein TadG